MRLGKVKFCLEYVVDLDNEKMVNNAKDDIVDIIYGMAKYQSVWNYINIDKDSTGIAESDIPEFLRM